MGRSWFAWLPALTLARLAAAWLSNISDCDETFNYWEPLHFWAHGQGLQTWEYAPQYALRSWLYLALHWPVVTAARVLAADKILGFLALRAALGLACAACEARLLAAVDARLGPVTSGWLHLFLLASTGLFASATALLPSTFAMYCTMLALASWLKEGSRHQRWAVWWGACGVVLGWPFLVVALAPIGLDLLAQHGLPTCLAWGMLALVATVLPSLAADTAMYGRPALSTLNIVVYNLFPTGTGSELYGTEPWHFYLRNLALNFNIAAALALLAPPLVLTHALVDAWRGGGGGGGSGGDSGGGSGGNGPASALPWQRLAVWLSPLYLWVGFFSLLPHKEERFLFVVYPLVCLAAAVAMASLRALVVPRRAGALRTWLFRGMAVGVVAGFVALSLARTAAVTSFYGAPRHVFTWVARDELPRLAPTATTVRVCVGQEWYRFPSHFFLPTDPAGAVHARLEFVKSGFTGQLPQHFDPVNGTRAMLPHFNHENAEEPDRYVPEGSCHYLVDLEQDPTTTRSRAQWEVAQALPFLDASRSPYLTRALYLPGLSAKRNTMADYVVLRNKALAMPRRKEGVGAAAAPDQPSAEAEL